MTFGYQQGGDVGQHKQALGFDAGASEKLRLQAAEKERHRIEKDRAKMKLTELERKLDHNKLDMSHRLTEMRRLETEIIHLQTEVQGMQRDLDSLDKKEHDLRVHSTDFEINAEKVNKQILEHRRQSDSQSHVAAHLEGQITQLQQQLAVVKKSIVDSNSEVQKLLLNVKQLEGESNKSNLGAQHAKSEREYKVKELENKKKSEKILEDKKHHEAGEVERLKGEDSKLELEIKMLEIKVK
jgi:chromosome segregation ATPase